MIGGRAPFSRSSMLPPTARLYLFLLLILTVNVLIVSLVSRVIPQAVKLTLTINHHKYISKPQDLTLRTVYFQLCYCLVAPFKSSASLHSHQ